jgi:hypothetical protein
MNKFKKFSFSLLLAAMATIPQSAMSQVTIGADQPPQDFSVLELISNSTMGLRLPQLTQNQRNALQETAEFQTKKTGLAKGLTIYNLDAKCVQYWNGMEWTGVGVCETVVPTVVIPTIFCTQPIPPVEFMTYNLGADPTLSVKEQMKPEYAADILDARVYGGWFQWGRKDWMHAVDTIAHKRYATGINTAASSTAVPYDVNGQPTVNNDRFLTSGFNWYVYSAGLPAANSLWGNGAEVATETPGSGVICAGCSPSTDNDKYFQSTNWAMPNKDNNPCPSGFRIPTQDEWERIGAYDCHPNAISSRFYTTNGKDGTFPPNNPDLVWVPVVDGVPDASTSNGGWTVNALHMSGYAIYRKLDWLGVDGTGATTGAKAYISGGSSRHLYDSACPTAPMLFLPAAGTRYYTNGSNDNTNYNGDYWMSTVQGSDSYFVFFSRTDVSLNLHGYRASGMSVRCVKE